MALRKFLFRFNSFKKEPFEVEYSSPPQFYRPRFFILIAFNYFNVIYQNTVLFTSFKRAVELFATKLLPERIGFMSSISFNIDKEDKNKVFSLFSLFVNFFISSVSVRRTRTDMSSATIRLYFKKGEDIFYDAMKNVLDQVFFPLCPIRIFMQGRFVESMLSVFTGFISNVSYAEEPNFKSIVITCYDISKLLILNPVNINPGVADIHKFNAVFKNVKDQEELNLRVRLFSQYFTLQSYRVIINTLINGNLTIDLEMAKQIGIPENLLPLLQQVNINGIYNISEFKAQTPIISTSVQQDSFFVKNFIFKPAVALRPQLIIWGDDFIPYFDLSAATIENFNSEYKSRWEIIKETSERIFFDFYATSWGDFHTHPYRFHPHFMQYDLFNVKGEPAKFKFTEDNKIPPSVYILTADEMLNLDITFNETNYLTAYDIVGQLPFIGEGQQEFTTLLLMGSDTVSSRIMSQLGLRYKREFYPLLNKLAVGSGSDIIEDTKPLEEEINSLYAAGRNIEAFVKQQELIEKLKKNTTVLEKNQRSKNALDVYAAERLKFHNSSLFNGSATLILRPEMDIAKPCYVPDKDLLFYIDEVTHEITVGSSATTTISFAYGHKPTETFDLYGTLKTLTLSRKELPLLFYRDKLKERKEKEEKS